MDNSRGRALLRVGALAADAELHNNGRRDPTQIGQQGIDEDDNSSHLEDFLNVGHDHVREAVLPIRSSVVAADRLYAKAATNEEQAGEEEQTPRHRRKAQEEAAKCDGEDGDQAASDDHPRKPREPVECADIDTVRQFLVEAEELIKGKAQEEQRQKPPWPGMARARTARSPPSTPSR